jgi:hypothetical protein
MEDRAAHVEVPGATSLVIGGAVGEVADLKMGESQGELGSHKMLGHRPVLMPFLRRRQNVSDNRVNRLRSVEFKAHALKPVVCVHRTHETVLHHVNERIPFSFAQLAKTCLGKRTQKRADSFVVSPVGSTALARELSRFTESHQYFAERRQVQPCDLRAAVSEMGRYIKPAIVSEPLEHH